MTFGEKLQALRKERAMSQEGLAEQIGVSRQAVSRWEMGGALPDVENLRTLCRLFGVSADYLIDDEFQGDPIRREALPAPAPKPKAPYRAHLMAGAALGGLGLLGVVILWVLSTMIESYVPYSYLDAGGRTWYSSRPGYAFEGFIEKYRLGALLFLCGVLLAAGLCLLGYALWKRWKKQRT